MSSFHCIELSGPFTAYIRQGYVQDIIVIGHQNIIDRLDTAVDSGIWEMEIMISI